MSEYKVGSLGRGYGTVPMVRITGRWLSRVMGWYEGDVLIIESYGDKLVLTKKGGEV